MPASDNSSQLRLAAAGGSLELGALGLIVEVRDERLGVRTASGDVLDPLAAKVLQSLGGEALPWLRVVEGLQTTWNDFADLGAVGRVGQVLGAPDSTQNAIAETTNDPAVMVGLAAAGIAAVVRNPSLPARAWELIRWHDDEEVQERAIGLADMLPPALASHPDPETRSLVASNPACSSVLLDRLLRDPTDDILYAVAGNPSASSRTLMHIARFKSLFLRAAVAGNPSFRVHSYRAEMLLRDRDGLVLAAFARRTNVSGSFLRRVDNLARARARRYPMVLMALRSNPTTPKRLRRKVDKKLSAHNVSRTGRVQLSLRWAIVCMAVAGIVTDPRGARPLAPLVVIGGIWGIVRAVKQRRKR